MDSIMLSNGIEMPALGLGTFQVADEKACRESVLHALKCGYRLIDTAACYGNERAVGAAIEESGLARTDLFLVSKVWIQDAGYERTMRSFEKTLENLGCDYLDLYLIHMPYGDYHGSWRAMEELYYEGKVRAIGVCNYLADRLIDLIESHEIVPAVNQIELHPFWQERPLRRIMDRYGVRAMAWGPFAEGQNEIFTNPVLAEIAREHGKSTAQVILRWLYQDHAIAIPKSVHKARIEENFAIDDFELTPADMVRIDELDCGHSLILNVASPLEAYRLHGITFEQ